MSQTKINSRITGEATGGAVTLQDYWVRIDKIHEGQYIGELGLSDGQKADDMSLETLSREVLTIELLKRGAHQADIEAAFSEADMDWFPHTLNGRQ